jgi:hypothetical protein
MTSGSAKLRYVFYPRNKISLSDANPFLCQLFPPVLQRTEIVFYCAPFPFPDAEEKFRGFFKNRPWWWVGRGEGVVNVCVSQGSIQSGALRRQAAGD